MRDNADQVAPAALSDAGRRRVFMREHSIVITDQEARSVVGGTDGMCEMVGGSNTLTADLHEGCDPPH